MYELCYNIDPELWQTFYEVFGTPASEWKEVRRKLSKNKVTIRDFLDSVGQVDDGDKLLVEFLLEKYGEIKTMW